MLVGIPLEHENSAVEPKECAVEMSDYLVKVAQDRCKASFARVFGFFAPRLRSYALKQLGNEALAMELVQDTMSNVWQKAHLFNSEKGSPSTWIFTIARNKRIDRLRRENRPLPDLADPAFAPEPVETGEKTIFRQQEEEKIRHALKNLPDEQAKMIFSAYYEEKSHREIADESGIPLGTVKSRIRLALNRLRAHLDEIEGSANR